MKTYLPFLVLTIALLGLAGCKKDEGVDTATQGQTSPTSRFQDAFLESGRDRDSSYINLITTRQADSSLNVLVTKWVEGDNPTLQARSEGAALILELSESGGQKRKCSRPYVLTPAMEATVSRIVFRNLVLQK